VNGVTVADMVSLMDYAKTQRSASGFTAATLPVTTVQQWGVLAGPANEALSDAVFKSSGVCSARVPSDPARRR
jgi:hypothetical protein